MTALTITSREWNRISPNLKDDNGQQKTMLYYDRERGTCSVPVQLDDKNGVEYGPYSFQEHELGHRVYAYSMAEALQIIQGSGHNLSMVKSLKRLHPYPLEEQAKLIGGRLVYTYGGRYEISGLDRQITGTCDPGLTLKQIYERHFPIDPRDGKVLSQSTLFYSRRGERHIHAVQSARLELEEFGHYLERYVLRFTRVGGTREHKAVWDERPHIIAAEGRDVLARDTLAELKDIYQENAYLGGVCTQLDAAGVPWRAM